MVQFEQNTIVLKNNYIYTDNNKTAYKVKRGKVVIFVVPFKGEKPGRRINLYEATEGDTIPSLCFRDNEYNDWKLLLRSIDEAELHVLEDGNTKVLKRKFASKVGLDAFEHEGFERSIVEYYQTRDIEEDRLITKSQKSKTQASKSAAKLIYNVFNKDAFKIADGGRANKVYDAMKIMCDQYKIPIASYGKVLESCGEEITPQNIARVSHFCYREIVLEEGWFRKDLGPVLAYSQEGNPIACIPKGRNKYIAHDVVNGTRYLLNESNASDIKIHGFMIYKTFPNKKMGAKDLFSFCKECINGADLASVIIFTVIGTAIGVLLPILNEQLYDKYIPLGDETLILSICCVIASFMIGNVFFSIVDNVATFRLSSKLGYVVQSATYDRLFNLPESFFREYESADLAQRAMGTGQMVNGVVNVSLTTMLSGVCSLFYLIKMFTSSVKLTLICILMLLIYSIVIYLISNKSLKHQEEIYDIDGKANSKMYQFLSGIDKIRIAGVESRALLEFYKPFSNKKELEMRAKNVDLIGDTLALVAESIFSMVIFYIIIHGKMEISVGAFVALNTSFGYLSSGILKSVEGVISINAIKPQYRRCQPILEMVSEFNDDQDLPGEIKGNIELSNVTFSYGKDAAVVIDGLSLNIKSGEYIGIVGSSGCGKSTLLKLLLGFEKPNSGRVMYDNKDIDSIDKRELRKKLGVVLQDGELISGSIMENITITSPKATKSDVEKVIKAVGLEEDIKNMPMGLHTVLSEGCGTISGGQKQRILIARAIVDNPRIIYFDEATSALDNITQAKVCETMEKMDSTRIVIAHRLSTIIKCDRIIVMDSGRIVEEGTFNDLIDKKGRFYELAKRQMC